MNEWMGEVLKYHAEAMYLEGYIKGESDWNAFSQAVQEFVQQYLESVDNG